MAFQVSEVFLQGESLARPAAVGLLEQHLLAFHHGFVVFLNIFYREHPQAEVLGLEHSRDIKLFRDEG